MKSVLYVLVVISSLACIRAAPTTNVPSLADKLNQFVTFVDDGFQNIAQTLRTLRDGQELDHKALQKLIKLEKQIEGKQQVSHADLQRQISAIADTLSKSLATFDKLNKSVSDLKGLVLQCPTSWKRFDEFCYKFETMTTTSINSALAACKSLGATLTRVRSAKHQQFLLSGLSGKRLIVGGNDRDTEGTWVWPDGDLISAGGYTNWASGAPRGYGDCMYVHTNGKWEDLNCRHNYFSSWIYVCEKLLK